MGDESIDIQIARAREGSVWGLGQSLVWRLDPHNSQYGDAAVLLNLVIHACVGIVSIYLPGEHAYAEYAPRLPRGRRPSRHSTSPFHHMPFQRVIWVIWLTI